MNTLNNVPSQGTFGQSIAKINENFSLLQEAISELSEQESLDLGYFLTSSELQTAYPSPVVGMSATVGTQFEIYRCTTEGVWSATGEKTRYTQQVVTSLPSNPDAHTIYCVQGVDSWTEEVYSNNSWLVLATHSGALSIDETPTANSTNPVQSGGVYDEIRGTGLNYELGGYYDSDGAIVSDDGWAVQTDYLPVTSGDTILWHGGSVLSAACMIVYNSSKVKINAYATSATPRSRTMPTNAAYVRISFYVINIDLVYIQKNGSEVWRPITSSKGILNEIKDAKTNLNKIGFVGAGNKWVQTNYYNILLPKHTYRITFVNNNWDVPSDISSGDYRFMIRSFIGSTATPYAYVYGTNDVASFYTFTIGDATPNYLQIGGRATEGTEVAAIFEDVTNEGLYDKTRWPKHFTKNDYAFRGRTLNGAESAVGTSYIYVFKVSDYIFLSADGLPSGFKMQASIYEEYSNAMLHNSTGVHAFGNPNATPLYSRMQFSCWGVSDYQNGFLSIKIEKTDASAITDEEITLIESTLFINFYPINIQGEIDEIKDDIKNLHGISYNEDNFVPFKCASSGVMQTGDQTRVKFIKENFIGNKTISVDISDCLTDVPLLVYGVGVWSSLSGAQKSEGATKTETIIDAWTSENKQGFALKSGVLAVFLKKSNDSAFTAEEYISIINNISINVESNNEELEDSEGNDTLPIGEFANTSTTIVSSASVVCVPYIGVKYNFKLPNGIKARVSYGSNYSGMSTSDWVENGDSVQLPEDKAVIIQRLDFSKADGGTIDASTIANYVQADEIAVSYSRIDAIVTQRNYDNEKYVKAAVYRLFWADSAELLAGSGVPSLATIVHISDLHGDIKRFENAAQYANILGAHAICSSGDNVLYVSSNGSLFLKDCIDKYPSVPFLNCIGNHECYPANTYDNTYMFDNHISPYIVQGGYKSAENVAATMPYYYVDIDSQKIRIITLNQYDNGCYYGSGLGGRLGQTQVTWFCNTLLSTPENYGVVIMMHSPEAKIDTPETMSNWNQTINWDGGNEDSQGYAVNGLYVNEIRPIRTIVDAFISKTALSMSYDENTINGNNGETVTINADFSNVASGVEFICYITGHRHKDNVGYLNGATNKQLVLNICCGNCHYPKVSSLSFSEGTDIPRGDKGACQDAFNVYGIDRQNGRVKVARVGSNINLVGIDRKFLLAPYKD